MKGRSARNARILLVPYLLFMAWAFLWPVSPAVGPGRSDLVGHLVAFAGLAVLLSLAVRRWWVVLLVGIGLGVLLETAQLLIPGRTFDRLDMAANLVGVMVGALLIRAAPRRLVE